MEVERDLSPSYAEGLGRALRSMQRHGVDFGRFKSGSEAKDAVRDFLAAKKEAGHVQAMVWYQKALNHYAAFLGLREPTGEPCVWPLAKVPRRRLDPYTAGEVQRILGALKPGFKGTRQGAMLFLFAHTGLRKGEVFSLKPADFDRDRGAVLLLKAEKDGKRRWVNLPDSAWNQDSRLMQYLETRDHLCGPSGALWVDRGGWPLTVGGFSSDMYELRCRSGIPLNFNRWRHSKGLVSTILQVPDDVQSQEWGHGDRRSTAHYMHSDQGTRREVLARLGVPGYVARDRGRELVDAISLI